VNVCWQWPKMSVECAKPCPTPCAKPCDLYKRDAIGNKVPTSTYLAGNANTDKATGYEATLVVGQ
jgi:hypothetical protein